MKSLVIANGIGLWGWLLRNDKNETVALSSQAFSTSEAAQLNLAAFVMELVNDPASHLVVDVIYSPLSETCYI